MGVADILEEEDQKKIHSHEIVLWPRRWNGYRFETSLTWQIHRLMIAEKPHIPDQPGIYTLLVQPGIAHHPACSYLMYVGKTKSLHRRFGEYLQEKNRDTGRPRILRLLNGYPDHVWFCFTELLESELHNAEEALIEAYLPPCNEQFPGRFPPGKGDS
jgi:hypothetical protein